MTAEFAVVIPAVVLVLWMCLAAVQVAGAQVRLQDAAAITARSLGRGDPPGEIPGLGAVSVASSSVGLQLCVRVSTPAPGPAGDLFGITLQATSCALDESRER